jgi:hypothetical protein
MMKWLLAQAQSKRKRLLKLRTPRTSTRTPETTPSGNQKFDEATGQVYTETTAAIQTANDLDWTRQTVVAIGPDWRDQEELALIDAWKSGQSEENLGGFHGYSDSVRNSRIIGFRGARSLQDVAVETILQNITDITLEGMECLPIQLVRRIWHAVNKR